MLKSYLKSQDPREISSLKMSELNEHWENFLFIIFVTVTGRKNNKYYLHFIQSHANDAAPFKLD